MSSITSDDDYDGQEPPSSWLGVVVAVFTLALTLAAVALL
jgi:hypothetical protein